MGAVDSFPAVSFRDEAGSIAPSSQDDGVIKLLRAVGAGGFLPGEITAEILAMAAASRFLEDGNVIGDLSFPSNLIQDDEATDPLTSAVLDSCPDAWTFFTYTSTSDLSTQMHMDSQMFEYVSRSHRRKMYINVDMRREHTDDWSDLHTHFVAAGLGRMVDSTHDRLRNLRLRFNVPPYKAAPDLSVTVVMPELQALDLDVSLVLMPKFSSLDNVEEEGSMWPMVPDSHIHIVDFSFIPNCRRLSLRGEFALFNRREIQYEKMTEVVLRTEMGADVRFTSAGCVLDLLEWFPNLKMLDVEITTFDWLRSSDPPVTHIQLSTLRLSEAPHHTTPISVAVKHVLDRVVLPSLTVFDLKTAISWPEVARFLHNNQAIQLESVRLMSSSANPPPLRELLGNQTQITTLMVDAFSMYGVLDLLAGTEAGTPMLCPRLRVLELYSSFCRPSRVKILSVLKGRWTLDGVSELKHFTFGSLHDLSDIENDESVQAMTRSGLKLVLNSAFRSPPWQRTSWQRT